MAKGGKRQNAGRPAGVPNKRTRDLLQKAEQGGVMPIDVLLEDMRLFYKLGNEAFSLATYSADLETDERERLAKEALVFKGLAADRARDVCPYIHPKLASIDANVKVTNVEAELAELE